jgi:hypothetical protein
MKLLDLIRNKIIRRFINLRVLSTQQVSYDEIIRIELLVAMCLSIFIAGTIYVTLGVFLGLSVYIILTYFIFFCTIVPLDLYLIRIGKYNQAKLLMMVFGSVYVC